MNKKGNQIAMIIVIIIMIAFSGFMFWAMKTVSVIPAERQAQQVCKYQDAGKLVAYNKLDNDQRQAVCNPPGEGRKNIVTFTYPKDLEIPKKE